MPNVCASYRLDFASGAWRQVGVLDRDAFARLTAALRRVAGEAPKLATGREVPGSTRGRLACGEVTAVYEVHHETCTVYVVDVIRGGEPRPSV